MNFLRFILIQILVIQTCFAQEISIETKIRELNKESFELRYTDIEQALKTNLKALDLCALLENDTLKALTYNVRGVLYKNNANYDSASYYTMNALILREKIGDKNEIVKSYNNLGSLFYVSNQFGKAKYYYFKTLAIRLELNDTIRLPMIYNNLGNLYHELSYYDSAIFYYQNGLKYESSDPYTATEIKLNLGVVYNATGKYSESLLILKTLESEFDDPEGKALCLLNLGWAYEMLEVMDSSLLYYKTALIYADSTDDLELKKDLKKNLFIHHLKSENDQFGLSQFNRFNHLNDSLTEQYIASNIADIEARYQIEKKDAVIRIEAEKTKRMEAENDEKYWVIIALLGLILFIFLAVTFTIRFYRQKRKLNRLELDQNKQEIARLMHGYELDLFEAQNFGQHEERQRIASDLHDRLGGLLAAVNLQVESLKYKEISEQKEEIAKVKAMVSEGIKEVRNVAHDMRAEALTKHGLKGALEAISQSINNSKKVKVDLYLEDLSDTAGSKLEREVYKIIMELISNTLRHAHADSITLQINEIDHEFTVVYEDDGVGFLYSESQHAGLGMENIKERVKKLFGNLLVDSRPGGGTTIIIKIPRT
ncbi:MAG: two-component system NarL family sensor kinase [Crocinitomix sp.]|jgi:two-component system NarL family sensor kinase